MNNNQFDPKAMSSFTLWADNILLKTGQAYSNVGSQFYPVKNNITGYYTYGAPYKPFVSDISIGGATIISGVYLNNNFAKTGVSGLVDINYAKGEVYFSSQLPAGTSISGNYAVKDFIVTLTDSPDEVLMFETKYDIRPKTYQVPTGLPPESITVPIIFIKNDGGENELFTLDGLEDTRIQVRAVVLADSQFLLDSVGSLFKDRVRTRIPLLNLNEQPFNNLGGYKSGVAFNYQYFNTGKVANNTSLFIDKVEFSKFSVKNRLASALDTINPQLFFGFVDFDISMIRRVRF